MAHRPKTEASTGLDFSQAPVLVVALQVNPCLHCLQCLCTTCAYLQYVCLTAANAARCTPILVCREVADLCRVQPLGVCPAVMAGTGKMCIS